MLRIVLAATILLAGAARAEAQEVKTPSDREAQKQAERERKDAERGRKEEEKAARQQPGVRCARLHGKKKQ